MFTVTVTTETFDSTDGRCRFGRAVVHQTPSLRSAIRAAYFHTSPLYDYADVRTENGTPIAWYYAWTTCQPYEQADPVEPADHIVARHQRRWVATRLNPSHRGEWQAVLGTLAGIARDRADRLCAELDRALDVDDLPF